MKLFDATLSTLERALDVRLERQNVLAGNLANANTPGYVPHDVDFAAAMRESAGAAPGLDGGVPVPTKDLTLASAGHRVAGAGAAGGAPAPEIPLAAAGSHLAPVSPVPQASAAASAGPGLDGNAVDVDRALAAVSENALLYGAAARAAQKKLAILRYAASDGTA